MRTIITKNKDIIYTPRWVVEKIIPIIPDGVETIWECAAGNGSISKVLSEYGYNVISTDIVDGQDFLNYEPSKQYDFILTNPPWSLKTEFLARLYELGKPFLVLLPAFSLESMKRYNLFVKHGICMFMMWDRIKFLGTKRKCPFHVYWFGWNLKNFPNNTIQYLD